MKIYISGPITGVTSYRRRFARVERALRNLGHTPMNPAVVSEGFDYDDYMKICRVMLEVCDAIFMMPGWEKSHGANIELGWAEELELPVFYSLEQVPDERGENDETNPV